MIVLTVEIIIKLFYSVHKFCLYEVSSLKLIENSIFIEDSYSLLHSRVYFKIVETSHEKFCIIDL